MLYHTSENPLIICSKTFHCPIFIRPFTFSPIKATGFLSFNILAISSKSCPLGSSIHARFPIILKVWHGNPQTRTSWSGISDESTSVILLQDIWSPKFSRYVATAATSISLAYNTFDPCLEYRFPRKSNPHKIQRSLHPHQENRETTFIIFAKLRVQNVLNSYPRK